MWLICKEVYVIMVVVILMLVFFGFYLWSIDLVLIRLVWFLFVMFGV